MHTRGGQKRSLRPHSCTLSALQLMTAEVGNQTLQVSHIGPLLGPIGQVLLYFVKAGQAKRFDPSHS